MKQEEMVALNYRYTAAYNEVTARIAQRQQAMQLYVAVVTVIVAALVNVSAGSFAPASAARPTVDVGPLFLGIPIVSVCFAFLTLKHELMISNLRSYLARLEHINVKTQEEISYNADERWRRRTLWWRTLHDGAAALLVLAANAFAFYVMSKVYPAQFTVGSTVFFVTGVVAISCVIAVLAPVLGKRWKGIPDGSATGGTLYASAASSLQ